MTSINTDNGARDISLVLCGQAGQGLQSVERFLTGIFKSCGYHLFTTKEFMSRVRGGMNSTQIRISEQPVNSPTNRIDVLVPLEKGGINHVSCRITPETIILYEKAASEGDLHGGGTLYDIPFTQLATESGNKVYVNTVAIGAIIRLLGIDLEPSLQILKGYLSKKDSKIIDNNLLAARKGFEAMARISPVKAIPKFKGHPQIKEQILLSGTDAIGLGAIAGGCNFISSYPMSPSTGVLLFLAENGGSFGIVVEQAEDEIAAMNMAIGAWYAGARAMVTTSGGGFALMTEGLSLAGMLESPMVIHLAQRPGPATGLPTRTEQGDLELALYAGHGEFPRIIYAPGTLDEGFYLTQRAFNIADKYQMPVFVLTDQYYIDSYYNTPAFDLAGIKTEKSFIRTSKDYKRYAFTAEGISPRGIPGFGDGLVCLDSDEHDEDAHITENCMMRTRMVDKRLSKLKAFEKDTIAPKLYGPEQFKKLIVCWGSTLGVVREALKINGADDTAIFHFSQVYPLDRNAISEKVGKAEKIILIENNATGQFGKILKTYASVEVTDTILKYNGLCFASDELANILKTKL